MIVGVAVAHSRGVFAALWHVLPMFRYQRIPQRAMVLAYLGLSLLVTLGASRIISRAGQSVLTLVLGGTLVALLAVESLVALPRLPPTADIRREVRDNEILNHIARQDGPFRIHAIESRDRNWGIEHVTVPLGLSNLVGWDHLWLLEYLGAEGTVGRDVKSFIEASYESRHKARYWGMMNVRFVTATRRLNVPGLRLVAEFPACGVCQPAKSAGPFLYENEDAMPRAWMVPYADARVVHGNRAQRLAMALRWLDKDDVDARRTVFLDLDYPFEPHFALGAEPVPTPEQTQPPVIETYRNHFVRIRLDGQRGYLVLAEKFAHFPGWRANSAAGPRPVVKANGVATAIPLAGREEWLELSYWPKGLTAGLLVTFVALILVPVVGCYGDRMCRKFNRQSKNC